MLSLTDQDTNQILALTGRTNNATIAFSVDVVLECARGIAALWVFMFHVAYMFETSSPILYEIAKYGYQGVPLFFVISGYCIYAAAEKTLGSGNAPLYFLKRRLIRILPAFWLSIIVVMAFPFLLEALSFIKTKSYMWPNMFWFEFSLLDWIQIFTLTKGFFSSAGHSEVTYSPLNAVYWSLAIELQFYLVVFISLYFKSKWGRVILAASVLSLLSLYTNYFKIPGVLLQLWPSFLMGIVLRIMLQNRFTPFRFFEKRELVISSLMAITLIAGLLLFVFSEKCSVALFCSELPNIQFISASLYSAILIWVLGGLEHAIKQCSSSHNWMRYIGFFTVAPMLFLGQMSYSLYLTHGKIYQLPMMLVRQVFQPTLLIFPILIILMTIGLSYIFYIIAEQPFQARLKKHLGN